MKNKILGLYEKYSVSRNDGKTIGFMGCIVLEWDDKNSREGIKAFSKTVRKDGYISLANDLDTRLAFFNNPKLYQPKEE